MEDFFERARPHVEALGAPAETGRVADARPLRAAFDALLALGEETGLRREVETAVTEAILDTLRRTATEPAIREALPAEVLDAHAPQLAPRPGRSDHILLGTAQTKTNPTSAEGVRLLLLDSDPGMDFMFCDMGVIEYWIDPEALAAGRFDKAFALSAGG